MENLEFNLDYMRLENIKGNVNTSERIKELDNVEMVERLTDYGNGYIEDVMNSIVDSNIDIYTYDLLESVTTLYGNSLQDDNYLDRALEEGTDFTDFNSLVSQAQYFYLNDYVYNIKDLMLEYLILETLEDNYIYDIDNLDLLDLVEEFEESHLLDNVIDIVADYKEQREEEEEER